MKSYLIPFLVAVIFAFSAPATATDSDIIRIQIQNHFFSGLPTQLPSIALLSDGTIQAFRAGTQNVDEMLSSITRGELVMPPPEQHNEIQTAFQKLLTSEQLTFDSIASPQEKVMLIFSVEENQCPPCDELVESLKESPQIGGFTIKKIIIENNTRQ